MKQNKKRRRFKQSICGVAILVVASTLFSWSRGASLKAAYFMGPRFVWMLISTTRIQALRLSRDTQETRGEHVGRYSVTSTKELDPASIAQIKAALLGVFNNRPYVQLSGKSCEPEPGIAFRVWSGTRSFDVLACLSCAMLAVSSDPQQKIHRSWEDFDQQRPQVLDAAKRVFPHDKELARA